MTAVSSQGLILAELVLMVHVAVIGFNLFGLVAIPLGAWRGWAFVRAPLWRMPHLASMGVVALQAAAGRACFLTLWQDGLSDIHGRQPLIMGWVNAILFWPLPMWSFTALYLAIFAYVLALLWIVPPRWPNRRRRGPAAVGMRGAAWGPAPQM